MASSDQTLSIISKLTSNGASIPGLKLDNVLNNFIKQTNPSLSSMQKNEVLDFVKNTKKALEMEFSFIIANMNNNHHQILEGIKAVGQMISQIGTNAAIPAVISSPPSTNNSVYTLTENIAKVNAINTILNTLTGLFLSLLQNSVKIKFDLPDSVLSNIDKISDLKKQVSDVPLP